METYRELKDRHQQEVDSFPLGFAFGNQQFEEMMKKWGLDAKKDSDLKQIAHIFSGAYIRKTDIPAWKEMNRRHREEMDAAIEADTTGDGFIYQMFYAELINYEYGYTGDVEDALAALGLTAEEVNSSPRLMHGLSMAATRIYEEEM